MKTKDTTHYEREFLANSRTIRAIDDTIAQYEEEQEDRHGIEKITSVLNLQELHFKKRRLTKRNRKLQRILKYTPLDLWTPIVLPDQKTIDNVKEYKLTVPESFWEKQDLLRLESEIDALYERKSQLLQMVYNTPSGIADSSVRDELDILTRTEASLVSKAEELRTSIATSQPNTSKETIQVELESIQKEDDIVKSKTHDSPTRGTIEEKALSELQNIRIEMQEHEKDLEHWR